MNDGLDWLIAALVLIAAAIVFHAVWPDIHRSMYVSNCIDRARQIHSVSELTFEKKNCLKEYLEFYGSE